MQQGSCPVVSIPHDIKGILNRSRVHFAHQPADILHLPVAGAACVHALGSTNRLPQLIGKWKLCQLLRVQPHQFLSHFLQRDHLAFELGFAFDLFVIVVVVNHAVLLSIVPTR